MTADPEAVTRTLAEHRRTEVRMVSPMTGLVFPARCSCGWEGDNHDAHLASVLASLPDDRLAEAERCNCHQYSHARLCPVHTQEDYDAAEATRELPDDRLAEAQAKLIRELSAQVVALGVELAATKAKIKPLAEVWDEGFNCDYEGDGWPPNPYRAALSGGDAT